MKIKEIEAIGLWSVKWSKFIKNSPKYAEIMENYDLIRNYEHEQFLFYVTEKIPPKYFGHIRIVKNED